ncbi:hypothetical protein LJK88_17095 [Paenibacillus sp. P26]|nr:hypothetical protein LJK88_17095 [Paenibacillus sp. P26]
MEQARHHDPFAEIAFREHPGNKDEVREIPPAAYEKQYFAPGPEKAKPAAEPSYEAQLADFHQELKGLREKYRPFMSDWTPAPPCAGRGRSAGISGFVTRRRRTPILPGCWKGPGTGRR